MTPSIAALPHALYRFYGRNCELLYIGLTMDPSTRWPSHAKKAWWLEVHDIRVVHFPDRASVAAAERQAIRTERPRYNVQHNRSAPRRSSPLPAWRHYVTLEGGKNLEPDPDDVDVQPGTDCYRVSYAFRKDAGTRPFERKIWVEADVAACVTLDRDGWLQRHFDDLMPDEVLRAVGECARSGLHAIWASGRWRRRSPFVGGDSSWLHLYVPLDLVDAAALALIQIEQERAVGPLRRLTAALSKAAEASEGLVAA